MDQFESNQQGSIRQKHNQWYYRLRTLDENGKWISHEFKGGATKKETERMLREALDQYNERGFMFQPGNVTVSELADMWYNDEVEHSAITPRGREGYKHVIRQIKESSLGTTKLRYVSIEHIQAYVDEQYYGTYDESGEQLTPPHAESTVRKHFVVLNGIFKYAVYPKKLLSENLMQYVKRRKKEKPVDLFADDPAAKIETITYDELQEILEFLRKDATTSYLALPIELAYHTGMRAGEVCGLTWDDIDFNEQTITVRRSMYYDNDTKCWELKKPKSGKSRMIDIGDHLTSVLKQARKDTLQKRLSLGGYYHTHYYQNIMDNDRPHCQVITELGCDIVSLSSRSSKGKFIEDADRKQPLTPLSFVCCKTDGELLTTQTLKYLNKLVQKELPHIEHFHFHCLRHSYASMLVANGANFKDVQALMGHSDIRLTLNTYSHVTKQSRRKAINILEAAIQENIQRKGS